VTSIAEHPAQASGLDDAPFVVAGHTFRSRLMVGTGKYRTNDEMVAAIEASGAEVVTVAVRRVDLDRTKDAGILHHLDPKRFFLLSNTAGCYTADEAMRYARLAREAGFNDFVKLEVIGDRETLLPDADGLLVAARELAKEGFKVLAYTNDDLVTALRLEDAGCAAVMPLASPIGSGLGLINPFLAETKRTAKVRVNIPNTSLKLQPGMYVNIELSMDMGEGLTIPVSAVMPTGSHTLVFVDKGEGRLEPRFVQLGKKYGDSYEVRSGLKEGERVVASANFLIDAESKVQGAVKLSGEPPSMEEKP